MLVVDAAGVHDDCKNIDQNIGDDDYYYYQIIMMM